MQCSSVCLFDECVTPNGWNYPNITRPFSILYYVIGGSAYYTFGGEEKPFLRGHLYIMPAGEVFSLREDENDKFHAAYVHFYTTPAIKTVLDIDVSGDDFLCDAVSLLRKYVKCRMRALRVKSAVEMLLSYISESKTEKAPSLPEKIKMYVENNFVSVFKDSDLSGVFNYSNSYLTKLYKTEYKMTPKQYASRLVLRECVTLLDSGMAINEISSRLEFSSPENFSRFFKSAYACSPSYYARKYKNSNL